MSRPRSRRRCPRVRHFAPGPGDFLRPAASAWSPSLAPLLLVGVAALLLAAAGCGVQSPAPRRPAGSVLWVGPAAGPLSEEPMERLAAVGLDELFLDVARVDWQGAEPRLHTDWQAVTVPERQSVTLVLTLAEPPADVEPGAAAAALASRVESLVPEAQRRSLLPVGIHVHPARAFERSETTGSFLAHLARRLGDRLPLSVTLEPARLDPAVEGQTAQLIHGVGAVVCFLYGQWPDEPEEPAAWSLEAVMESVGRLEALADDRGFGYLVGVVTLGRLELPPGGDGPPVITETSLRSLLARPELELGFGLSLEDTDRRLWKFDVRSPLTVASRRLAPGASVRVSQLGGEHVRALRHRLEQADLEHHLGEAYFRPPRAEEGLSLGPDQLASALDRQASRPRIEAHYREERRGGRVQVVVELENVGDRGTDIARVDANFIDLKTDHGSFIEARSLGDFQRYTLIDSATGDRTLRSPDTLRLFVPYLAAGERIVSGQLLATGQAAGRFRLSGSFRLPDGTPIPVVDVTGRRATEAADEAGADSEGGAL